MAWLKVLRFETYFKNHPVNIQIGFLMLASGNALSSN